MPGERLYFRALIRKIFYPDRGPLALDRRHLEHLAHENPERRVLCERHTGTRLAPPKLCQYAEVHHDRFRHLPHYKSRGFLGFPVHAVANGGGARVREGSEN
jgi:hypothetical protein